MSRLKTEQGQGGSWLRLLRRYPRVKLEATVALAVDGKAVLAHAHDIGEGGIGLLLPHMLADGAMISLSFYLPGCPDPIEAKGQLIRPRKDGDECFSGVSFLELSTEHRQLLRRYINMRRFLHGDLRAPSDNPSVGKRMDERLGKVRRLTEVN